MIDPQNPDYANTPASRGRASYDYRPLGEIKAAVVSVLTPFYNTDKVFLETAASVLRQSFQEWEWIIVDDGSVDPSSLAMLETIRKSDPRILVFRQSNSGPSSARNKAFKNSGGQYVCLLDSDDLLEPTFMEKAVWFLESQPEFAFCNSWSVNFGDREFLWTTGFERGAAHIEVNSGPPISVIRRSAFAKVGGFDESIRFGHEDWDFWLTMADAGHWGHTLPEYLEWYRVRKSGRFSRIMNDQSVHDDFSISLKKKYGGLQTRFPSPQLRISQPYETVPVEVPFANRLIKSGRRRMLLLVPWMITGGADKVNLDWVKGLIEEGYDISICATLESHHEWHHLFAHFTPDIFILPNFLHLSDYPRFITYLIGSRQIDTVLIAGSTIGYLLLPYLKAHCTDVTFVDLCHVEEMHWLNGGHPRFGLGYQSVLDLNIVTTRHLRDWMVTRGGDASRIRVCYTGVDTGMMDAMADRRKLIRESLGINEDLPVIVSAGRICAQKRPELFVEILSQAVSAGLAFRCYVAGDGALRPLMEDLIHRHSLAYVVKMLGTISHQKWLEFLSAADIFLLPSEYEGISVALYESLAMKNVVPVMSAVGGQSEVIDPDSGFLISPGPDEVKRYVEALSVLISDPARRVRMANAGSNAVSGKFSFERCMPRLVEAMEYAHELSQSCPRSLVDKRLARELATLSIEYTRMSRVADYLWAGRIDRLSGNGNGRSPLPLQGIMKLATLLGNTKPGRFIYNNRMIVAFGQWLVRQLEKRRVGEADR